MKRNIRFKPSPAARKFSRVFSGVFALIGLGFVAIGVTQLIPSAGIFGLVWTAMAVAFVVIGIAGALNKDGAYGVHGRWGVEIEDEETPGEIPEDRLKKLQSLYDQRLITTEEFEEKRKEILKEL